MALATPVTQPRTQLLWLRLRCKDMHVAILRQNPNHSYNRWLNEFMNGDLILCNAYTKYQWMKKCSITENASNCSVTNLAKAVGVNFLWPSDAVWWHSFGSTSEVMNSCLSPSHYMNNYICQLLWYSPESDFTHWNRDKMVAISQMAFS